MERVFGKHCVRAALQAGLRHPLHRLSVYQPIRRGRLTEAQRDVEEIVALAEAKGLPIEYASKALLDQWSAGRPHQASQHWPPRLTLP